MSNIKRYLIDVQGEDEHEHGEWVYYEDHFSEVSALQEEIVLLESKLNFDWESIK